MGIRESLLNTITSVSDSDFVRLVTSAGTSSKATVQNLFKSFESNLGAKSSLTTSDYIRVVGSDNVSYKQPMSYFPTKAEVDALFTKVNVATGTAFTIPSNYRGVLFIHDSTSTRNGVYMVAATGAGAVNVKTISEASEITLSATTNTLTITPASGTRLVMFINANLVATT